MASRAQVHRALDLFEAELTRDPDVVGLGITSTGDDAAIAVYVREPAAGGDAAVGARVPASVELPVEGGTATIAVRVQEIGTVVPEGADADAEFDAVADGDEGAGGAETFTIE
ncbi:MAG: hypothetical protein KDB35_23915 [Acidimicrobiales bacterium]|nr:hypothetical protein [Acidimicrobiales bacterium]